jgi:hypothetical protein
MKFPSKLSPLAITPALLFCLHCGADESGAHERDATTALDLDGALPRDGGKDGGVSALKGPRIETRLTNAADGKSIAKFVGGAASAAGLQSLKYFVKSIQICESLEPAGSGFNNPGGCLQLYAGDGAAYPYGPGDDYRPLAEAARRSDVGFIDLMSPSSRQTLAGATLLTREHVRSYHYGIINWALPIKVTARVQLNDGSSLYSHDGESRVEEVGADRIRDYYTRPSTQLDRGPAEEAVVLLPNGGNWFKFQSPLTISQADIDEQRAFVLDLVFNPDGIVKGFSGDGVHGQIRERIDGGFAARAITVPMLDLAPVPHRASDRVVRESYRGAVRVGANAFDLRIELYSVEGDANGTVYGVDVKSLVNSETTAMPPELTKVSFLERAADGSLSLLSFKRSQVITGLTRVATIGGTTRVSAACATHEDRAGAEGGAAFVLDRCPTSRLDVTLTLTARTTLEESIPVAVGGGADAGVDASSAPLTLAPLDAALAP